MELKTTPNINSILTRPMESYVKELKSFLRIPSVSTDSAYSKNVHEAANFVAKKLNGTGVEGVKVMPTDGYPVVYGERFVAEHLPTILIYGHFDVQPADPIELWESDPFDPQVLDGKIYARGACDDKAQMMIPINAVEGLIDSGQLGYNLKFLFEGEEEIGSRSLGKFVTDHKEVLACDACLVVDTFMHDLSTPAIIYGVKGAMMFEVSLQIADQDMHSGIYGGVVDNPILELSRLIDSMKDSDGKVVVPGFYDGVNASSEKESKYLERLSFLDGVPLSVLDIQWNQPTLEFNGIQGGYSGEGFKTIIPSKASVKFSIRTVPGQDLKAIKNQIEAFVELKLENKGEFSVESVVGCGASVMDTEHWIFKKAEAVCGDHFDRPVVYKKLGGSIPVVTMLKEELEVPSLLLGFGLESDNIHAPNEHYHLSQYFKGIEVIGSILKK